MGSNDKTLKAYDENVDDYVSSMQQNTDENTKHLINSALALVPKDGQILELGSANGRDADYIESLGYSVMRTDAATGFVELIHSKGKEARVLNALTQDFGENLNMILAIAVFVHFDNQETQNVFNKAYASLKAGGLLVFNVKQGTGSEWATQKIKSPRFFNYWDEDSLRKELINAGFQILELSYAESRHSKWFQVIAKK